MNPLVFGGLSASGLRRAVFARGQFRPLQVTLGVGGCCWHLLDARDIAQHVTVHGTAPTTMNHAVSNTVSKADTEKLWIRDGCRLVS